MCNKEKFWRILCERIGRPDWAERPDYQNFEARLANRARLTEELDGVLLERTTAEWLERFAGQVPAAPVHDVAAALDNPFVVEEGRVRVVPHPNGEIRLLAPPVRCPGEEMPCNAAPPLGADTDSILGQLGFAPGEIARLRKVGAV
jgi:crotonobetainyl-CoA:carnitine CoA-transferase CaiB-like acyl-CoA transferase